MIIPVPFKTPIGYNNIIIGIRCLHYVLFGVFYSDYTNTASTPFRVNHHLRMRIGMAVLHAAIATITNRCAIVTEQRRVDHAYWIRC